MRGEARRLEERAPRQASVALARLEIFGEREDVLPRGQRQRALALGDGTLGTRFLERVHVDAKALVHAGEDLVGLGWGDGDEWAVNTNTRMHAWCGAAGPARGANKNGVEGERVRRASGRV